MLIHATSVAIEDKAVLLTGASGTGKSDLALRLIDEGAVLIADDQTFLRCEGNMLLACVPDKIVGMMEVRHIGLVKMSHISAIRVALCVDLMGLDSAIDRLPEPGTILFLDRSVRRLRLPAFAASTPAKIRVALKHVILE